MPETELEVTLRHAHHAQEEVVNYKAAGEDLFATKPTQKDLVYEFVKSHGRVWTHQLNAFGLANNINSVGSRARELKAEGKIWRVSDHLMKCLYPNAKEEVWSTHEADK